MSIFPVKTRKEHKHWMTQEILELMDERKMLKSSNTQYQELIKVIRKKCNEAKEIWLSNKCSQIETNSLKTNKAESPCAAWRVKGKTSNKSTLLNIWDITLVPKENAYRK